MKIPTNHASAKFCPAFNFPRATVGSLLNEVVAVSHIIITMSKRMKGNLPYLQILAKCRPKVRNVLLEHGTANLVTCICECSLNLLKGVIPLTPSQKQSLLPFKRHLHILANKKISRKRKKSLNRKGDSLLSVLLPPVLGVLESLLTK